MCHGQLLSQSFPKARKEHRCGECRRPIKKGRRYVYTSAVVEGDFSSSKLCLRCQAFSEIAAEGGDRYGYYDYCPEPGTVRGDLRYDGAPPFREFIAKVRKRLKSLGSSWRTF